MNETEEEYKDVWLKRKLNEVERMVKLKFPFYNKLKNLIWVDSSKQNLKPIINESSEEITFSLSDIGFIRLTNFDIRASTGESRARVEIILDQVTVNELMDLIQQLQDKKVYRKILNPDGSLPDWKKK